MEIHSADVSGIQILSRECPNRFRVYVAYSRAPPEHRRKSPCSQNCVKSIVHRKQDQQSLRNVRRFQNYTNQRMRIYLKYYRRNATSRAHDWMRSNSPRLRRSPGSRQPPSRCPPICRQGAAVGQKHLHVSPKSRPDDARHRVRPSPLPLASFRPDAVSRSPWGGIAQFCTAV